MIYAVIAFAVLPFFVYVFCAAARRFIWDEPPARAPWN